MTLRETKKSRTRDSIQKAALGLIAEHGYDATTCEQIAAAAEVSPATLFRYFATKEDIVLQDVYDPMIAEAVRARPPRESTVTAVRRGLAEAMAAVHEVDIEVVRQRTALILSVPALRARSREQQESLADHLAGVLADREGRDPADLSVRVMAAACAASVAVGVEVWARRGGTLPDVVDDALSALAGLTRRRSR